MGQGSAEALAGFRHPLGGKKEPWPGWDLGQQEGFRSRPARVTWVTRMAEQGRVDRAVLTPGWDISWAGATHRFVSGLEMCPLASLGQGLTAPGAGMPSCTMARRSIFFQTEFANC